MLRNFLFLAVLSVFIFSCEKSDNNTQNGLTESKTTASQNFEVNGKYVNYSFFYTLADTFKNKGFEVKYSSRKNKGVGYSRFDVFDGNKNIFTFTFEFDKNGTFSKRDFYVSIKCFGENEKCLINEKAVKIFFSEVSSFYGLPKEVIYALLSDKEKTIRYIFGENPPIVFSTLPEQNTPFSTDIKIYEYEEVKDWYLKPDSNTIIKKY